MGAVSAWTALDGKLHDDALMETAMTVWHLMALRLVSTGQWQHLTVRQFGRLKGMGLI